MPEQLISIKGPQTHLEATNSIGVPKVTLSLRRTDRASATARVISSTCGAGQRQYRGHRQQRCSDFLPTRRPPSAVHGSRTRTRGRFSSQNFLRFHYKHLFVCERSPATDDRPPSMKDRPDESVSISPGYPIQRVKSSPRGDRTQQESAPGFPPVHPRFSISLGRPPQRPRPSTRFR